VRTEVLLFSLFGVVLSVVLWVVWRSRQVAREHARLNEDLATLGRAVQAMSHDLDTLFGIVLGNVSAAMAAADGSEVRSALADVQQAASSARRLVAAMRIRSGSRELPLESAAAVLRLLVSLVRRNGVDVDLDVSGDLVSKGPQLAAFRLFQNLLSNAERATKRAGSGHIHLRLTDAVLRITNPLPKGAVLDESIYEEGKSYEGSLGLGLAISRQSAAALGWRLRHEVEDETVAFIVEPLEPITPQLSAFSAPEAR